MEYRADRQIGSGQCAGAAMDWTQTSSTGNVAPTINDSINAAGQEPWYGGAVDLHP